MVVKKKTTVSTGVAAMVLGGVIGSGLAQADTYTSSGAASRTASWDSQHVINLENVDISVLIDDVSTITGYTFIVHPSVRGKVTVSSQTPLSTGDVFQVFLSTLRVHGYTAIPGRNGIYKIVPEQDASASAVLDTGGNGGDQVETAVFKLRSMDAVEAAKMIKPVTNAQGQVSTSTGSNSLIVVDYASNIDRVREIVARIDEDRSQVTTLSLSNMTAAEMAKTINGLLSGTSDAFNFDVAAIAVDSSNTLILRGDKADVARMAEVARQIDREAEISEESLKVIQLRYATASDLAPILESLGGRMAEAASRGGAKVQPPTVVVHPPTNALVLNAEPQILRQMEKVVADLDVRRAQVLVEAIVVELSDNATRELGLQLVLGGSEDNTVPFAATNFSRSTPSILSLAGALVFENNNGGNGDGDGEGGDSSFSGSSQLRELAVNSLLSTNGGLIGFGGTTDDGGVFGAIINAVDDDSNSNILSTPSVMALDNEEASFLGGQEIPITTGEALGSNNSNPFRTVERKDVGVQLDVRPQISDGDTIRLFIRQEVSSILGPISQASTELITNKRSISTTILADNGEIIVLGGLIQEDEQVSVSKVPLLGDIPGIGRAFRSEGISTQRTNLMVFLRPTIVRDTATARAATQLKYDYMLEQQRRATPDNRESLDELVREVIEGAK